MNIPSFHAASHAASQPNLPQPGPCLKPPSTITSCCLLQGPLPTTRRRQLAGLQYDACGADLTMCDDRPMGKMTWKFSVRYCSIPTGFLLNREYIGNMNTPNTRSLYRSLRSPPDRIVDGPSSVLDSIRILGGQESSHCRKQLLINDRCGTWKSLGKRSSVGK